MNVAERISDFLASDLPLTVGWAIVHSTWQIALVCAVVAVLLAVLRSVGSDVRYGVAGGGLIMACALPLVTATIFWPTPDQVEIVRTLAAGEVPAEAVQAVVTAIEGSRIDLESAGHFLLPVLPWLFLLWAAGVLVRSGTLVMAAVRVRRLRRQVVLKTGPWVATFNRLADRMGVGRAVRLAESARAEVPFVVGWLKPLVVVPASAFACIPPAHLEEIIAHELAHVRRSDYLVNLAQLTVETLFFYHPGVWWLSNQIRVERENCCDDLAAEACYGPISYARALVQLEELRGAPMPAMGATGGGTLLDRVRRLVSPGAGRGSAGVVAVPAMVLVFVVVVFTGTALATFGPAALATASVAVASSGSKAERPSMTDDDLRRYGIHEQDVRDYEALGYTDRGDILSLARYGLDPADVGAYQALGLAGLDARALVRLERHGLDATDTRALFDLLGLEVAGTTDQKARDLDRVIRLARLGIDADEIRSYRRSGFDLHAEDIRRLAQHGVDGNDLRQLRRLGYALSVDDVVRLQKHGVDAGDIRDFQHIGMGGLSPRQVIELARHGIDAQDVVEFRDAGFGQLDVEQVIEMARHGVSGSDVRRFRRAGLTKLTVEQVIELVQHGVSSRDAARAIKRGRARTVDAIVDLARHGEL